MQWFLNYFELDNSYCKQDLSTCLVVNNKSIWILLLFNKNTHSLIEFKVHNDIIHPQNLLYPVVNSLYNAAYYEIK